MDRFSDEAVFVFITADYDVTAGILRQRVLDTETTRQSMESHNVVPVLADWTRQPEDLTNWMSSYGVDHEPVALYFPASSREPIRLGYTFSMSSQELAAFFESQP